MSIIKHVTLQKIVAHDFRYDPRISWSRSYKRDNNANVWGCIETNVKWQRNSLIMVTTLIVIIIIMTLRGSINLHKILQYASDVLLVINTSELCPVCTSSAISSKTHILLPLAECVHTAMCMWLQCL